MIVVWFTVQEIVVQGREKWFFANAQDKRVAERSATRKAEKLKKV